MKCFEDFLRESGRSTDFLQCTIGDLDDALREFYFAARKTDGSLFKKSALRNKRYGLKRHLKDNRNVDILSDPAFIKSNEVFKAMSVELKRNGLGKIDHHPPISEQDLLKLYSAETLVYDTNIPYGVQRKVWFELSLYLCRRGRANLREMDKSTFTLETDDLGKRYIGQITDELDKNHKENSTQSVTEGRLYEIPDIKYPLFCMKRNFKLYF